MSFERDGGGMPDLVDQLNFDDSFVDELRPGGRVIKHIRVSNEAVQELLRDDSARRALEDYMKFDRGVNK